MAVTPYVVGQWVREERFYGRGGLLEEILNGNRNCLWLLGTRRIGKTSILKQLEHLTSSPQEGRPQRYFPLFWDFQGSEDVADLHASFGEVLADAQDRLEALGVSAAAVASDDLFTALSHLRRELRAHNLSLLLLADEAEELVKIHEKAPQFLRRLGRALHSQENIRAVFASTIRLWNLAYEEASSASFLEGFTPPLLLRGLSDDEARGLVRQTQLPLGSRPHLDERTVEVIRTSCNNHPYLLQILSERCLELGDLDRAIEAIAADQMVSFFFAADLAMLTAAERRILHIIEEQDAATSGAIRERLALETAALQTALQRLEHLGFIMRSATGEYSLVNYFFRRWFGGLAKERQLASVGRQPTIRTSPGPGSGSGSRAEGEDALGTIDNRYELLARVGRGASGEVFKAHDTLLRSVVALKILKREYTIDDAALERLRREVVLSRDLSHPNIVKIYHLGEDRGQSYITMQYVGGRDLAGVICAAAGPLVPAQAVVIAAKLASALAALHRFGVLHRDIKPSNVLIDETGEPRITDFGLARLKSAPTITNVGDFLGTPAYASPEAALGESPDERSDLYALGLVIFEMVTGRLPFVAESVYELLAMRVRIAPPVPSDLVPGIPAPLSDLILRCLARDREQRFQSARELHEALEALPPA